MIKIFLLLLFVFLSTAAPAGKETVAERFGIHRLLKSTRRNTNSSIVHQYTPTNSSISDESLDDSSRRNLYASVTYRKHSGKDRSGGDISCGRYGSHQQLKDACSRNKRCIGYTVWGTNPWCLKTTSSRQIAHAHGHDFYEKVERRSSEGWIYMSNGKHYINLNGENFSQYTATKTVFDKVQLLSAPRKGDRTVEVDINNVDFAKTSNPGQNHHKVQFIPWGVAKDCRWGQHYRSPLSIDLSGTPFALRSDYPANNPGGWLPHGEVTCSSDKKKCTGRCGGFCGYCGADERAPLILDVKDQVLFDRYAY